MDGAERDAVIIAHLEWCRATVRLFIRRAHLLIPFEDAHAVARLALVEAAGRYRLGGVATFQTFAHRRVTGAVLDMSYALCGAHQDAGGKRRRYRPPPIALDDLTVEPVEPHVSPEAAVASTELVARLLARAHPRERAVLTAHYVEGRGLAEVGERLGISESRACQLAKAGAARIRAAWR